ncbi:MAG TPA: hypothetical protein VN641_08600 [Urbifossiella sp.]|nr:hypothetical protein [Urbifossiella sp.]
MLVGIDFDNTIVCYDRLFHRLARERELVPDTVPANKTAVRDYLRSIDRETDWTELQGIGYGPRIVDAEPFPGVRDFIVGCKNAGIRVAVVSHKTRKPYLGEPYDLHEAAHTFLARHAFYRTSDTGLSPLSVWLESTKEGKLERIAALGCDLFVDDLPEFLGEAAFPAATRKILFDPANAYGALASADSASRLASLMRVQSWSEIGALVHGKEGRWAA